MAMTYSTPASTARQAAALNATGTAPGVSVNGQTAGAGMLVIGTSALSGATGVLATFVLPNPPFSIANKVSTLLGVPLTGTPSAAGTAALAELRDSAGNTVGAGLIVGVAGSGPGGANPDIVVTTVTFSTTEQINVNSGTITTQ
jgi:hypothetical protein